MRCEEYKEEVWDVRKKEEGWDVRKKKEGWQIRNTMKKERGIRSKERRRRAKILTYFLCFHLCGKM